MKINRAYVSAVALIAAVLLAVVLAKAREPEQGLIATNANITGANANVITLLSPFLSLPSSDVGRKTLAANLDETVRVNASASKAEQEYAISDVHFQVRVTNEVDIRSKDGPVKAHYGLLANLAGGLPAQPTPIDADPSIEPKQLVGGYGPVLGPIYQKGILDAGSGPLAKTFDFLSSAGKVTGHDSGVAKSYFANGTADGKTAAVAPTSTLPVANGLPNTTDSVFDLAYGVKNTDAGQNKNGNSRPYQVAPSKIVVRDPTPRDGISKNSSFPSGHTNYAYTGSILLGMLTPELYQAMLARASDYGNNRLVVGVHYALDVAGSRAFAQYELANLFSNPAYVNNATMTGKPLDLASAFGPAQAELRAFLEENCKGKIAACALTGDAAAGNPYLPSDINAKRIASRLTYAMPALSFEEAPREAAPADSPAASILLAPIFGGTSEAAKKIAPAGGLYGTLSTPTIEQILINTQGPALAAFHGTPFGYWLRLNLYDAIGYFGAITGTLTLAPADTVLRNVIVAKGGVLGGSGTIGRDGRKADVAVRSGGTLAPGGQDAGGTLTVNGALTLDEGASLLVTGFDEKSGASAGRVVVNGSLGLSGKPAIKLAGTFVPGQTYDLVTVNGGSITGDFGPVACEKKASAPCGTLVVDGSTVKLTIAKPDTN